MPHCTEEKKMKDKISEFAIKYLGFCGCFDDEIILDIINVIAKLNLDRGYVTEIAEDLELDAKYVELILYILDNRGYTEHGTAVRGSWLSEKGKKILDSIIDEVSKMRGK